MLTEIIIGRHYRRRDGLEVIAKGIEGDTELVGEVSVKRLVRDDWIRWRYTKDNQTSHKDWERTCIAGQVPRSRTGDPERGENRWAPYDLVELIGEPMEPEQLSLFE